VQNDITLFAEWTKQDDPAVIITYNPNGGLGPEVKNSVSKGSSHTVNDQGYTRSGYSFANRYTTSQDGSGTVYTVGSAFTATGNITLYAQWTQKTGYSITYYPNGGTGQPVTVSAFNGDNHKVADQGYTRPGYIFTGTYNTKSDGTGTTYQLNQNITITGNLPLYAVWHNITAPESNMLKAAVTKLLEVPDGIPVPSESFTFVAEKLLEDDYSPTPSMPDLIINDINFSPALSENDYSYTGNAAGINYYYLESNELLGDIDWPHPGLYTYGIREIPGTFDGIEAQMNYSEAMYILAVTVSNEDVSPADGKLDIVQINAVLYTDDGGNELEIGGRVKVNPTPGGDGNDYYTSRMIFTNTYWSNPIGTDPTNPDHWKLSVSNRVEGIQSNRSLYFRFAMKVTAPDYFSSSATYTAYVVEPASDDPVQTYRISADPTENGADSNGAIRFISGQSKLFSLKHGQYLVFLDTPIGAAFTVTEFEETYYLPYVSVQRDGVLLGFEYCYESRDLTIPHISNATFREPLYIGAGVNSADFLNTREEVVTTGINLSSLPFTGLAALALCALLASAAIRIRRKSLR
jgi:uncharacterized repeat protein (TIGR02543 family)